MQGDFLVANTPKSFHGVIESGSSQPVSVSQINFFAFLLFVPSCAERQFGLAVALQRFITGWE